MKSLSNIKILSTDEMKQVCGGTPQGILQWIGYGFHYLIDIPSRDYATFTICDASGALTY